MVGLLWMKARLVVGSLRNLTRIGLLMILDVCFSGIAGDEVVLTFAAGGTGVLMLE
jgi:hypothetical protein